MSAVAKVFKHGGSQAVRLPKEFRFEVDEVSVQRVVGGVLLSTPEDRVAAFDAAMARIDARRDDDHPFPYPPEPEDDEPVRFDD
jgi:antitoxin VapB